MSLDEKSLCKNTSLNSSLCMKNANSTKVYGNILRHIAKVYDIVIYAQTVVVRSMTYFR